MKTMDLSGDDPMSRYNRFLLGPTPLKSYQEQAKTGGKDTLMSLGVSEQNANRAVPFLAAGGVLADLTPPGLDDAGKAVLKKGAKYVPDALKTGNKVIDAVRGSGGGFFRLADDINMNTDAYRGGTWSTNQFGVSLIEDAMKNSREPMSIGGSKKFQLATIPKNPLVVEDAILEDGSFSVVNNGYDSFLTPETKDAANSLYELIHRDVNISNNEVDLVIMNSLYDAGIPEEQALNVLNKIGKNKFDAAMDLIISKGLKENGYDGILLKDGDAEHLMTFKSELTPINEQATVAADPLSALKQEATKYKSAEEFVKDVGNRPYKSGYPMRWIYKKDGVPTDVPSDVAKILDAEDFQFNPRQKKVTKTSNNLYHTTPAENLESIRANGLTTGNKPRFEGVSVTNRISFSANEKGAEYYGGSGDVMLRTKRGYSPGDLDTDLLAGGEGYYRTGKNIPPEMLEVKINGKWEPLNQATTPTLPGTTAPTLKQLEAPKLPDELQLATNTKSKRAFSNAK
jgi:hypothetical protein